METAELRQSSQDATQKLRRLEDELASLRKELARQVSNEAAEQRIAELEELLRQREDEIEIQDDKCERPVLVKRESRRS